MNLYKAKFMKNTGFYFSSEEEMIKLPSVWMRYYKIKDTYYICGNTFFLDMYVPKKFRIDGFKTEKLAISYLYSMTIKYSEFDLKEKKKLGFLNVDKQEYSCDTIKKFNEVYRKCISYTQTHGTNPTK